MSDNERPEVRRTSRRRRGKVMNHWMYRTYYNIGLAFEIFFTVKQFITYPDLTSRITAISTELDRDGRSTKVRCHGEVGQ